MANRNIGYEIMNGLHNIQGFKKGNVPLKTTELTEPSVLRVIRAKLKLSQSTFAGLLGVSMRTLQDWELGRVNPQGPAIALLKIAEQHPEVISDLH